MFLFSISLDILMWLEKNLPLMVLNPTTQNLSENMEEKLVRLEGENKRGEESLSSYLMIEYLE